LTNPEHAPLVKELARVWTNQIEELS